jgi:uncharacterized protein
MPGSFPIGTIKHSVVATRIRSVAKEIASKLPVGPAASPKRALIMSGKQMALIAVPATQIRRFEPKPEWFERGPGGIHGIVHEARVLIWSQVLSVLVTGENLTVDADVLGWAAAIHDTQRQNDDIDPEHGARAAVWIERQPELIPATVPLQRVAYLCRWHAPRDHRAPEMTDELRVFKDADALDRWRIYDLDASLLRTKAAHGLLDASHEVWSLTDDVGDGKQAFEKVVRAAVRIGVLRAG